MVGNALVEIDLNKFIGMGNVKVGIGIDLKSIVLHRIEEI